MLGIDGGLRRGELLGRQCSDVDLKRGLMSVRHNIVRHKNLQTASRHVDRRGASGTHVAAVDLTDLSWDEVFMRSFDLETGEGVSDTGAQRRAFAPGEKYFEVFWIGAEGRGS